eukprot:154346_1
MTEGKQSDINEWLKQTKLGDKAAQKIIQRDVSIDELIEFEDDDLEDFAKQLELDTLAKNRFIASIRKLKHQKNTNLSKRRVFISQEENNAMLKLYEQYNKLSSLCSSIQKSIQSINEYETQVNHQIENDINSIINNINNKKNELLSDIDNIMNHKKIALQKQLTIMENYTNTVNNGRSKYESYMKQTIDNKQRKKVILKMTNDILSDTNISMALLTSPKIQFNISKYDKRLNELYDYMIISDCDQPQMMNINLKNVHSFSISIEYSLHEIDLNSPKKILEIVVEYAILPKSYSPQIQIKKKEIVKKDSNDDESNDFDSSDSEKREKFDVNDYKLDLKRINIEIDALKWMRNDKKIKYKKHKKNKYKIEELKSGRGYLLRMRARNASGFGTYSTIIGVMTIKNENIDKWDKNKKANEFRIEGHGYISYNTTSTWRSVFGKQICKRPYKYHWKLKIIEKMKNISNQWPPLVGIQQNNGQEKINDYF